MLVGVCYVVYDIYIYIRSYCAKCVLVVVGDVLYNVCCVMYSMCQLVYVICCAEQCIVYVAYGMLRDVYVVWCLVCIL